jgi:hypothetical protein
LITNGSLRPVVTECCKLKRVSRSGAIDHFSVTPPSSLGNHFDFSD